MKRSSRTKLNLGQRTEVEKSDEKDKVVFNFPIWLYQAIAREVIYSYFLIFGAALYGSHDSKATQNQLKGTPYRCTSDCVYGITRITRITSYIHPDPTKPQL